MIGLASVVVRHTADRTVEYRTVLNGKLAVNGENLRVAARDTEVAHECLGVENGCGGNQHLLRLREEQVFGEQAGGERLDVQVASAVALSGALVLIPVRPREPFAGVIRVAEHIDAGDEVVE